MRLKKVPRRYRPLTLDLRVQKSRTGRGLFTHSDIAPGSCVIEYKGRKVGKREMEENAGKYLFWTSKNSMIDGYIPNNPARFINHSCAPNCEIDIRKRRIYVFAKRTIPAGTELTYDYAKEYFNEFIEPLGCLCDKCRKKRGEI